MKEKVVLVLAEITTQKQKTFSVDEELEELTLQNAARNEHPCAALAEGVFRSRDAFRRIIFREMALRG